MRRVRRLVAATLGLAGVLVATAVAPARAQGINAALSEHLVGITTAFVGSTVLIYGALDEPGNDVAVVVKGPRRPVTVHRKGRFLGIWLERDAITFRNVPEFYWVATSRPLAEIASPEVALRHGLDLQRIAWQPLGGRDRSREEVAEFRAALLRNKQALGLFQPTGPTVEFQGGRLFTTRLSFPSNTPPGGYDVEVLNLRDGRVIGAQRTVLDVSKIGVEAHIYEFAHRQAWAYAGASLIVALGAGWVASAAFRRA